MKTRAAVAFEAKKPLEIVELDLEGLLLGEMDLAPPPSPSSDELDSGSASLALARLLLLLLEPLLCFLFLP